MNTGGFDALAMRLARSFAALSLMAEEQILDRLISVGDAFCTYDFEVDAQMLRSMVFFVPHEAA